MKKLDKTKTKPLIDPKQFVKLSNTYDGTNYVVDGDGNITDEKTLKNKFENEVIAKTKELSEDKITTKQKPYIPKKKAPKMSATATYNLYKSTASPAERKEFEQIEENAKPFKERKAYKAKMAALDAQLKESLLIPIPSPIVDEPVAASSTFLDDLVAERRDPDLDKGLGHIIRDVDLKKF